MEIEEIKNKTLPPYTAKIDGDKLYITIPYKRMWNGKEVERKFKIMIMRNIIYTYNIDRQHEARALLEYVLLTGIEMNLINKSGYNQYNLGALK